MKVLITGAAGFIGSSLTDRLLGQGVEVTGLDSLDDFYDARVKRSNLEDASTHRDFRLVEGDFRDADTVERLFSGESFDGVVHLGARAGVRPSLERTPLYVDVNLDGTIQLLEACRRHEVRKFVFASSSSVYGNRVGEPFSETDRVDEPVSPYAATKKAGELLCYTYHHLFGIDVTCLRFFTVYGPRQRPEMAIHCFTRAIDSGAVIDVYGDGSARRDFTYISDIVQGVTAALERCSGYRIYNLGAGNSVELREVIELIEKALGKEARIRFFEQAPGDVPYTFADVARAREELGYEPEVNIAEGIRRFVEWYRERKT
ncbi:MAG: GDP-mannose 4,6-dehydratase [Planctomycetota bacterium]|nr:GDP-mannose 4,6-dehydratase [Planctomycetota bacterium]